MSQKYDYDLDSGLARVNQTFRFFMASKRKAIPAQAS